MRIKAAFLLILGLVHMSGELFHLPLLKAVGAASGASPAPKVFSAVNGYETFSVKYVLEWEDLSGQTHRKLLTSEMYAQIKGPYNRRNVFGAVLAYGPVLASNPITSDMFHSAISYTLRKDSPLIAELGLDPSQISGKIRIVLEPLHAHNLPLIFEGS